ncbi:MAG: TldD/PmbA family protein [Oligoflexus sp.]
MLEPRVAHDVVAAGLECGADFVDVFVEKNVSSTMSYLDQKVRDVRSGTDFGIGIRVIFGTKALYGYTNTMAREELLRIVASLCAHDRRDPSQVTIDWRLEPAAVLLPATAGLDRAIALEPKIEYLGRIDREARLTKAISQVDISVIQRWQQIEIFNSEGLQSQGERHYTRIAATVIAQDGSLQARAFHGPGGSKGWEITDEINPEELASEIAQRAVTVLHAKPCPAGKMPVIIDNGFGGVIFHEACGHLLETTSVEKQASVFHDKMGELIAHPAVSAVDDGTIAGEWGSLDIDDEGTPVQRTQLIKEGRLESFLVDRVGEWKTGYQRTGSGRRQSYKFPPASRMRNTFIEAGPYQLEELIASVDQGLYAKVMGGGSVSPGTGDFNFAVEEAYLIKKGRLSDAVRGATLIGSGPETLKKISMVGSNFSLAPGMCGSVSGTIPVTVGQAALKVDEILVGGESA